MNFTLDCQRRKGEPGSERNRHTSRGIIDSKYTLKPKEEEKAATREMPPSHRKDLPADVSNIHYLAHTPNHIGPFCRGACKGYPLETPWY